MKLRFLTAGESHGQALTIIVDGLPAGLSLCAKDIDLELARRQSGAGRSSRMKIEKDHVRILSGIRHDKTMGSPIAFGIDNAIFENHQEIWNDQSIASIDIPRPGHGDFSGWAKFEGVDIRNIIERASARETASRTVAGKVAKILLEQFGVKFSSNVLSVNGQSDPKIIAEMINDSRESGDSLGGKIECVAKNVPPGLGSFSQWDTRLDGMISNAVMSVPGIKAVAIGDGFSADTKAGSEFRDPIRYSSDGRIVRDTNHAGGIEAGISNGQPIVVQAIMKPIPGVRIPCDSIDLDNQKNAKSWHERADTCVVEAAAVICENVIAWQIANAFCQRFAGDTLSAMTAAFERDRKGLLSGWKQT